MQRKLSALTALILLNAPLLAQEPMLQCGTHIMQAQARATDPTYAQREVAYRDEIRALLANSAHERDEAIVYIVPVVFHVLHLRGTENIVAEQVQDAVSILNRDFRMLNADTVDIIPPFQDIKADMKIEFRLATRDPEGNCTTGIMRYQDAETFRGLGTSKKDPWPRSHYLNIWVTDQLLLDDVAGYFTQEPVMADGIMILHDYLGSIGTSMVGRSRTLSHEVAHYLGLAHVWGEGPVGVACGDDGIEDTPITKGFDNCPQTPEASMICDPQVYENYQNYMDYSFCSKMFTEGQRDWARATLESTMHQRNELHTAENLQNTGVADGFEAICAPEAGLYAQVGTNPANPTIPFPAMSCAGTSVRFFDNSSRAFPTAWSWSFPGGTPATSTERYPLVQYDTPGWKTVTLTVSNAVGSSSITEPYAVHIGTAEAAVAGYHESFEGMQGEDLYPYVPLNYESNHTRWHRSNAGGATGQSCAMLNSMDRNPLDLIDEDNLGDYDDLVTPLLDLSEAASATLSFSYAYSTLTTDLDQVTEYLEVTSSTDCGRTWLLRTIITGGELVNNGNSTTVPLNEWTQVTLPLPSSVLGDKVRFRFRYVSTEFSGNLFIDDLWIGTAVGIDEPGADAPVTIFPNPTSGQFRFSIPGMERSATNVDIVDAHGKLVHRSLIPPTGGAPMELDARALGLPSGLYMLLASNETATGSRKLMVGP